MTVDELRTELRKPEHFGGASWIASANKSELEYAIRTGNVPDRWGGDSPAPAPAPAEGDDRALAMLALSLAKYFPSVDASVDESKVQEIVEAAIAKRGVKEIVVKRPDGTKADAGRQHKEFDKLLFLLGLRMNAWVYGPAGSGKTHAAHVAADALGLQFRHASLCEQTTKTEFAGFIDATGNYQRTAFRECYENGGVFLIDEIDRGRGNTLSWLNASIANGHCEFPDGRVEKNKDFVLVACANTAGKGADRRYNDAKQIGAATIDRFAYLEWGYDEMLERDIAQADSWVHDVQRYRKAAEDLKIEIVISPRASIEGAKMLAAGGNREFVESAILWKGLKPETVEKIKRAA